MDIGKLVNIILKNDGDALTKGFQKLTDSVFDTIYNSFLSAYRYFFDNKKKQEGKGYK